MALFAKKGMNSGLEFIPFHFQFIPDLSDLTFVTAASTVLHQISWLVSADSLPVAGFVPDGYFVPG